MKLVLILLAAVSLPELLLWLPIGWKLRKTLAPVLIVGISFVSGQLFGLQPAVWTGLVLFLSLYRVVNLLRLLEDRVESTYLARVARLSSLSLMGLQLLVLGLAYMVIVRHLSSLTLSYLLAGSQLAVALVILSSTLRHLKTTRPPATIAAVSDRDLPSLTVAIPARNETEDLERCLESLLTSTYPKLEILVLDDCSQNKHTPEIIRDFAHVGVRFLAGRLAPEHWLAKNYAYAQLADEANGELLLFCGVDARFAPNTLKLLVESLLQKHKSMCSVLPRNGVPARSSLEQLMVQPSRYAWELALPRRILNRPPVLSTCWLITADALQAGGGFPAVSRSSSPESYFARQTAQEDGYSFICSDERIGLSCAKSLAEQRATAIRTRYPQLHRRPEIAAVLTVTQLSILVGPFAISIAALITGHWLLAGLSLLSSGLLTAHYALIVRLTYRRFLFRGLWLLPFAAIYDSCLLNYSMWQYEFREVIWKGRNVCLPLMQAAPRSPET